MIEAVIGSRCLHHAVGQLISGASRGDPAAVDELLLVYLPRLQAFLRLRAGPALLARESASDLAQSVCRDVLENLERFQYRGEENFRRWLYATAVRKIADRYEFWNAQKRDIRLEVVAPGDESLPLEDYLTICTPSREAMAREELATVQAALDRLPDEQREAILLSRVLGLGRTEVAEVMGRSEGSVRMLLCRGLATVAGATRAGDA